VALRVPGIVGLLAAGLAAWRGRNLLLAIAAGMGGLWLARLWLG
jgi:branched-subunit amino acid transport protein